MEQLKGWSPHLNLTILTSKRVFVPCLQNPWSPISAWIYSGTASFALSPAVPTPCQLGTDILPPWAFCSSDLSPRLYLRPIRPPPPPHPATFYCLCVVYRKRQRESYTGRTVPLTISMCRHEAMVNIDLLPAAIADLRNVQWQETIRQTDIFFELIPGQLFAIQEVGHDCKTCPTPHHPLQSDSLLSPNLSLKIHQHCCLLHLPILSFLIAGLPCTGPISHIVQASSLKEGLHQRFTSHLRRPCAAAFWELGVMMLPCLTPCPMSACKSLSTSCPPNRAGKNFSPKADSIDSIRAPTPGKFL